VLLTAIKYYADTGFTKNEKKRISRIIHSLVEIEKQRQPFNVLVEVLQGGVNNIALLHSV
jgi:hypothetical protein